MKRFTNNMVTSKKTQNKNKIKLTESLKGNKVEKNYTRLWIVNYSRNNIK